MGGLHARLVSQARRRPGHAGGRRQLARDRPRREPRVDDPRHDGRHRDASLPAPPAADPDLRADRDPRDPDRRVAPHLLRPPQLPARSRVGRAGAYRVLHRLRGDRRARAPRRHGGDADRGGARLRRHPVERVPLRDAAADHAGRHRRRADGLHAVDRRFRHHLLHGRRRHGDAAAPDLLDDQDRGDPRGQRGVNPAHAAHVGADRHRGEAFADRPSLGNGDLTMIARVLAVAFAAAFALAGPAHARDELHLYNWNSYISDETVKRFETACQCDVVQTYYGDNEELLAKLAAGAKGYDVLVPTSNAVQALIRGKQLKPLDKTALPNIKNVDPVYLNTPFDPGNKYSVPYAMSTTIIGYNDVKMKELGLPTDTWAVIFEPKYLEKVKGRVTVLDDENELFAAALKYLGYSVNDTDEKHWKQAQALINKAKPYWAAFNASSYIKELTVGNIWLVHGYSNDIFQANLDAQAAKRPFHIVQGMPKEGAVLALDNMVIHKDAPRPNLAHKFMNFMLDGKNSAELTNLIGSGNPNMDAMQYINPEIANNKAIFPDLELLARLEMLRDLDRKQRRLLSRLWTEIKL